MSWLWRRKVEPVLLPPRTEAEEWEKRYAMYLRVFAGLKQGVTYATAIVAQDPRDIGVNGACVAEAILAIAVMDVKNSRAARVFAAFQGALKAMLPTAREG